MIDATVGGATAMFWMPHYPVWLMIYVAIAVMASMHSRGMEGDLANVVLKRGRG